MVRITDEESAMLGIREPIGRVIEGGRELSRSFLGAACGKIGHRVMAVQRDPFAAAGSIGRKKRCGLSQCTEHEKTDEHRTAGNIDHELILKKRLRSAT